MLVRFATALLLFAFPARLVAYAVLTHEALVDVVWETSIVPVLTARFPKAAAEELRQAHAFCYGGAIIQDTGYYPFGNRLFSDLTHYVRSGDFIQALLTNAETLNDLAFALGAMGHYVADSTGHPGVINITVPRLYRKLHREYGDTVTYEQAPLAHVRTEFGFDVIQVARSFYPSGSYHDFIGFEVPTALLDRACVTTYGLRLADFFSNVNLSLGTYRFSINTLIPTFTKAAWAAKRKTIARRTPAVDRRQFIFNLSRSAYEKEWGSDYRRPNFGERLLALVLRIFPKIGPLKVLRFRIPSASSELEFERAFDITVSRNRTELSALQSGTLQLPNRNLDTGSLSQQGGYALADQTYAELFAKLAERKAQVPASLEADYNRFRNLQAMH